MELLLRRAGLSYHEAAKRLGVAVQSLHQYKKYKSSPSVWWLVRLTELCGGRLIIELPQISVVGQPESINVNCEPGDLTLQETTRGHTTSRN